jgi:hypothetical protein
VTYQGTTTELHLFSVEQMNHNLQNILCDGSEFFFANLQK